MKQENMAAPTSPCTTNKYGKSVLTPPPPPPPPVTYPPNSPTHHVVTRHPRGSYSSPRARHRSVLGVAGTHRPSLSSSSYSTTTTTTSGIPLPYHMAGLALSNNNNGSTLTDGPPEPSQQRRAMEAAAAAERGRRLACEREEITLTADELRAVLARERRRTAKLATDLAALRCAAVQQQMESEVFEEGRINGLMRTVDHLQHELEREEEMITQKHTRLERIRREEARSEQRIDHVKEANTDLRSQLSDLRNSQRNMAESLETQDEMEEE